jgi:hypothetical protein
MLKNVVEAFAKCYGTKISTVILYTLKAIGLTELSSKEKNLKHIFTYLSNVCQARVYCYFILEYKNFNLIRFLTSFECDVISVIPFKFEDEH